MHYIAVCCNTLHRCSTTCNDSGQPCCPWHTIQYHANCVALYWIVRHSTAHAVLLSQTGTSSTDWFHRRSSSFPSVPSRLTPFPCCDSQNYSDHPSLLNDMTCCWNRVGPESRRHRMYSVWTGDCDVRHTVSIQCDHALHFYGRLYVRTSDTFAVGEMGINPMMWNWINRPWPAVSRIDCDHVMRYSHTVLDSLYLVTKRQKTKRHNTGQGKSGWGSTGVAWVFTGQAVCSRLHHPARPMETETLGTK